MSANVDTPPWEPDKTYYKLTLKGGKGYEATWCNIGASSPGELRRSLVAFFGWDSKESEDLTLAQLAFNATQEWHALCAVGAAFNDSRSVGHSRSNAPAAYAAASKPVDPKVALLAQIEEQTDVTALKRLYAENKLAFDAEGALMAAYKAKGKSLS